MINLGYVALALDLLRTEAGVRQLVEGRVDAGAPAG